MLSHCCAMQNNFNDKILCLAIGMVWMFHILKPNANGMKRQGLWEVIMSWKQSPRQLPCSFTWEVIIRRHLSTKKPILTRHQIRQNLDHGLFRLWSCDKSILDLYKPPICGILLQQPKQNNFHLIFWHLFKYLFIRKAFPFLHIYICIMLCTFHLQNLVLSL